MKKQIVFFKKLLMENGSDYKDYTEDFKRYLKMSEMGEMGNAAFSIEACKLHDKLMDTLWLYHTKTEDRELFAKILYYIKKYLNFKGTNYRVLINDWGNIICENPDDYMDAGFTYNSADRELKSNYIAFETREGLIVDEMEYREGSINGSSGYYIKHAHLSDEIKQKIYDMHLVPGIMAHGSYHENFVYAVGVFPEMLKDAKDNGVNLKCEF